MIELEGDLNSSENDSGSEDDEVNVTSEEEEEEEEEPYQVLNTSQYRKQNQSSWLNRSKVAQNVNLSENSDSDGSSDSQSEIDEADRVEHQEHKNPVSAVAYHSSPTKKDRFWEQDPDVYGIRRSGRSRKEPVRYTVTPSQDDSEEELQPRKRPLKSSKRNERSQKRRRLSSSDWPTQSSGSGSDSSDYSPNEGRSRPVPRASARVPGQTKRVNNNKSSLKRGYKDSDDERSRIPSRKATGNVCYKEESDAEETDEDDIIEVSADAVVDYEDDDRETIEKVLNTRIALAQWTGARTTMYSSEYEEMLHQLEDDTGGETTRHFLIKWKGWSHLHNTWESKETLTHQNVKGMKKLDNFIKRMEEIQRWKKYAVPEDVEYFECQEQMNLELHEEYQQVERVIGHTNMKGVDEYGKSVNQVDYLCKWAGLPYSEASWEDGPLISKIGYQDKIDSYLKRERCERVPGKNERQLKQKPKFIQLKKQPAFLSKEAGLELRDYQLGGVNFLTYSWTRDNSVILADEMGLGKTIQSIAFLSNLVNSYSVWGPFLLVVPLSTIAAWQREFSVWAPEINLVVYLGDALSRRKIQEFEFYHSSLKNKLKFNALLTTYEILLKDKDVLRTINWSALLVDEAHRLKNDDSLLYKVLFDFTTYHRVLVTGTPLQNSLKELWSLLHFIMPNRFSSWEEFEEKHGNTEEKEIGFSSLHKELEPFLFRRVKKDVEKSLPAKVEQILRVEMSSVQKQYYKWILTKNFKMLNKGMKGNSNTFLNIVMELKKCCNHSALIRPLDEYGDLQAILHGSGKLMLLDKLLCRLKETGHRVLIFSQMVRMLDILADYLQRRHFNFQRLDGSIRGDVRKKALDHFNVDGSEDFCFLLSTRAGGLGINLATADTVIIFDSDWNPQNDLQAQARAHRIGQKNQVNIYRLVTKGSVEEDIVERAKKKMVLDHLIIQRMDTTGRKVLSKTNTAPSVNTPFNKDELSAILKFGAEDLFKDNDGERDKELQEMDIDEILKRAETRESSDEPSTMGEELLSQFKVADFVSMDVEEENKIEEKPTVGEGKSWEDIIPEGERNKLEAEEEQQKQLELYLPKRPRKSVKKMNIGHQEQEEKKPKQKRRKKATSSSGDEFDENSKKKRGRPRTVKREDIEGFSDQEIRRFIKSYKKFGRPMTRLDVITLDAELEDKTYEEVVKLAKAIHDGCVKEMKEYDERLKKDPDFDGKKRGASLRIAGVSVNAPSLLKHEAELEPLDDAVPNDPNERQKYRFTIPAKSVHWDIEWDVKDDSMLLVGCYEHGLGSWDAIKDDPKLSLSKIMPPGNLKPQDKHLQTRAEYLIRLLKQDGIRSKAEELRQSSEKIKKELKKLEKTKLSKKKMAPKKNNEKKNTEKKIKTSKKSAVDHNSAPIPCPDTYQEPSQHAVENVKEETAQDEGGEQKDEKPKKTKKKAEKKTTTKPKENKISEGEENKGSDVPLHLVVDMDQTTFGLCKEKMRPVKRSLKLLENPGDNLTETEHVEQTRQCLLKIGDHIMNTTSDYEQPEVASDWRSNLWNFVAKFTAFDSKKLCKLYKHACKRRDEDKKHKEHAKKDGTKPHKHSSQKRPADVGAGNHDNKQVKLSETPQGWRAQTSSRDHGNNSWKEGGGGRDRESNLPPWRSDYNDNRNRSDYSERYSHDKYARREDPKRHDDNFRNRTGHDRYGHNQRPPQQNSGKSFDGYVSKYYRSGTDDTRHGTVNQYDEVSLKGRHDDSYYNTVNRHDENVSYGAKEKHDDSYYSVNRHDGVSPHYSAKNRHDNRSDSDHR